MIVHLAMIFDHEDVQPNPARGARLPFEQKRELQPPTADHIEAVHRLLPSRYRLPLLVLDATGMRLGELEGLTWGDVDEQRGRWRVSQAVCEDEPCPLGERAAGAVRGRHGARSTRRPHP